MITITTILIQIIRQDYLFEDNYFIVNALLIIPLLFLLTIIPSFGESTNANLYVSAENSKFNNHFSGSMVIEVVIDDPLISDTDEGKGEPDVTLNGKNLRMVQATDGKWYAYFANINAAKKADQISLNGGVEGKGLDFGVFCGKDTDRSVFGIDISDSEGVSVPSSSGLTGFTNGDKPFTECTGSPMSSISFNNVVRNPKSINTNSNIQTGQIGLNANAWPMIQLFSFDNVKIQYNRAGGVQKIDLTYDEIENISLTLDRKIYPKNAEVFVTISDIQLNQDPTSRDSWTFNVKTPIATFYNAFDENGNNAANGGGGLVNIVPHLSDLNFKNNGFLTLTTNNILELTTNQIQPTATVTDGSQSFTTIVTFLESEPNSGIFENFDFDDKSNIKILSDAPRGRSDSITYNAKSYSIITGSSEGNVSISGSLIPGKKIPVTITDFDQNLNPGARDRLDVFRSSSIVPTLQIGFPITLESASNVKFYSSSNEDLVSGGTPAGSSVPDKNSDRLLIDTRTSWFPSDFDFEMISIDLGISGHDLQNLLINTSNPDSIGTNWINFDLRSFQKQLDLSTFSHTNMTLNFGLDDPNPILIISPGEISSAKDFVQLKDSKVAEIFSRSGKVFLVINFDSFDTGIKGKISSETDLQPIIFDFFSFGVVEGRNVNNAIYRLELEETSSNSGIFEGIMEYAIINQVNINDPKFIKSIKPIGDEIKFLISDRLLDEQGINISYSDIERTGTVKPASSKSEIFTHSGTVSFSSQSYRFGQPVTVRLIDPDLNTDSDRIDIYNVIDDPKSPFVDTVGTSNNWLLEILIKDTRFKRCIIDGIEYGGLASTGFSLVETDVSSGIFEGNFKMPSKICDKTGTKLISTAGGKVSAKYNDFIDKSGQPNIFETGRTNIDSSTALVKLNTHTFLIPSTGQKQVILDGKIPNYQWSTPIQITIIEPDGDVRKLSLFATNQGNFRMISEITPNTQIGKYTIFIDYLNTRIGTLSFNVIELEIPLWIKNSAKWWYLGSISDDDFLNGIGYLIKHKIINFSNDSSGRLIDKQIPAWIKQNAKWWSEGIVSDSEFIRSLEFLVKKGIIQV